MKEWGVVLNFKDKTITIDEIILLKRNINSLTKSNIKIKAWALNNSLAHEPQSTAEATQCMVKILDAKYRQISKPLSQTNQHT